MCIIVKVDVFVIIIVSLQSVGASCPFTHTFIVTQGGCGKAPKLTSRVKATPLAGAIGGVGYQVGDLVRN